METLHIIELETLHTMEGLFAYGPGRAAWHRERSQAHDWKMTIGPPPRSMWLLPLPSSSCSCSHVRPWKTGDVQRRCCSMRYILYTSIPSRHPTSWFMNHDSASLMFCYGGKWARVALIPWTHFYFARLRVRLDPNFRKKHYLCITFLYSSHLSHSQNIFPRVCFFI